MNFSFQISTQDNKNQKFYKRTEHVQPAQKLPLIITLKQIHKLNEKQKWMRRFNADYDGDCIKTNDRMFADDVLFYIAVVDGKEVGFIRLNDKTSFFEKFGGIDVWNITDAYVKPAYRHNGVLRQMIQQAVQNLKVKMIYLTTDRYVENLNYYQTLGFTEFHISSNGVLGWAVQTSFYHILQKRNASVSATTN